MSFGASAWNVCKNWACPWFIGSAGAKFLEACTRGEPARFCPKTNRCHFTAGFSPCLFRVLHLCPVSELSGAPGENRFSMLPSPVRPRGLPLLLFNYLGHLHGSYRVTEQLDASILSDEAKPVGMPTSWDLLSGGLKPADFSDFEYQERRTESLR